MSPIVPVNFVTPSMVYVEPSASQLSSTSQSLWAEQKAFTASRSNGFPKVWANITAFVLEDKAFSSNKVSMLYCGIVTSTNTGTAPNCRMGVTVVGKPAATVITSSPRFTARSPKSGEVSAIKAARLAEEPEFTSEQQGTFRYCASCFSKRSV